MVESWAAELANRAQGLEVILKPDMLDQAQTTLFQWVGPTVKS